MREREPNPIVVLIEDEPQMRRFLRAILRAQGFELFEAETGERGLIEVADVRVHLTPIEYRLLAALAQHADKVVTQRQLLKQVWGPSHVDDAHYLRIYMAQLRRKLETDPARPRHLLTLPGVGYQIATADAASEARSRVPA